MNIRMRIREQLCLLIAITALLALAVLSVAVWIQSRHYMIQTRAMTLQVTANLKADQLAQDIALFSDAVVSITTRDKLQAFMQEFNSGNSSTALTNDFTVSALVEDVSITPAADPA